MKAIDEFEGERDKKSKCKTDLMPHGELCHRFPECRFHVVVTLRVREGIPCEL